MRTYVVAPGVLFDDAFLDRWGDLDWDPQEADQKAAERFQNQLVSRVATQRLGYAAGVEARALESIYRLFEEARTTCDAFPGCRTFATLTWHVLNAHVRPFTAKWHPKRERGALEALDTSDEFRGDLAALRPLLALFSDLLLELRDGTRPPPAEDRPGDQRVSEEMRLGLDWGIPATLRVPHGAAPEEINAAEREFIKRSRQVRGRPEETPHAAALALSGGGIRSATFSLGVLIALARRNILTQIDYVSTVSGGGYLGAFLACFLATPGPRPSPRIGLRGDQLPFRREGGEAAALRHLRHHSRYLLTGSAWEKVKMAFAQLYGLLLNAVAIALLAAAFASIEHSLRTWWGPTDGYIVWAAGFLGAVALALPLFVRLVPRIRPHADGLIALPGVAAALLLVWYSLGQLHEAVPWPVGTIQSPILAGALLVGVVVLAGLTALGRILGRPWLLPVALAVVAIPALLLLLELAVYAWLEADETGQRLRDLALYGGALAVIVYGLADVNLTSLHRHYRGKLANTFMIQPKEGMDDEFRVGVRVYASEISPASGVPYPLLNGALNVPGSRDAAMQGRQTDFFLFSPKYTGSPITGYHPTKDWEYADPELDLAAMMAISGAAASPQMGTKRVGRLSFWIALLNVRLGYWVKRPGRCRLRRPGFMHLLHEMFGTMNEEGTFLNVSDGGHIENLGVYELLKRRCKYIIAIDGEQDPGMTFHALSTLQRLAAIDMDVRIDIDLDDLRLRQDGLSRSHFKFCRILYPEGGIGYLLFLKLSLTGNEGEFIRRYRLDEPAFPHHSTADQFFTEAQFEAYRALGEHIGDKLFLPAIVGEIARRPDVDLEEWFQATGASMLDPR